jgi:hypothetical protein
MNWLLPGAALAFLAFIAHIAGQKLASMRTHGVLANISYLNPSSNHITVHLYTHNITTAGTPYPIIRSAERRERIVLVMVIRREAEAGLELGGRGRASWFASVRWAGLQSRLATHTISFIYPTGSEGHGMRSIRKWYGYWTYGAGFGAMLVKPPRMRARRRRGR